MPFRQFGYPCRFVDKVCRDHVPSLVSRHGPLLATPPFPLSGLSEPGSPIVSGTMKALRLPICVSMVTYWFASTAHAILLLCVRRSAPEELKVPSRPGPWVPAARISGCFVWTPMGSLRSSGDPSRAFAPLQDPGRTDVASPLTTTSMLPPLGRRRRLRRHLISGLIRSFGTRWPTLHADVAVHAQGSLPAGWLTFAGRELNPLDRDGRFQLVLTIIPLPCSPDATTLRCCGVQLRRGAEATDCNGGLSPWGPSTDLIRGIGVGP